MTIQMKTNMTTGMTNVDEQCDGSCNINWDEH